jgi:hypothetical protein
LSPSPSRWLATWWWGVHALAAAGVATSGLPSAAAGAILASLALHAWWRRPASPRPLELSRDGLWAVPGTALERLTLAEGTGVGPFWVHLKLAGPGARISCLLLRDQLETEAWRALQAELRRGARNTAH